MNLLVAIVLFCVGLALLVAGAEYLVRGSSAIARRLGVPSLVVGLTMVAFGTSLPELSVTLYAALQGTADIAIGNVVGSNIANILLILGLASVVTPLTVQHSTVWKEMPFALLGGVLLLVLGADTLVSGATSNSFTRGEGIALLGVFCIFLYYVYELTKKGNGTSEDAPRDASMLRMSLYVFGGLCALIVGGSLLVEQAVLFATLAGISEAVVGLTIVAVGTSLPELATSLIAARRGEHDIAVGNIIGSNIFNILFILGLTATITPLPIPAGFVVDNAFELFVSLTLFAMMFIGTRHTLTRPQGAMLFFLYVGYLAYLVLRG